MKSITIVKCVVPGKGYAFGELYPVIGHNNGIHIAREDENGDSHVEEFQTGGTGKGTFNPFDDSGAPSFDLYAIDRGDDDYEKAVDAIDEIMQSTSIIECVIKAKDEHPDYGGALEICKSILNKAGMRLYEYFGV